jgi:outer membrane immunogenic protein
MTDGTMTNGIRIGSVAITLAFGASAAQAADLPRVFGAPEAFPVYNWVGPYAGVNFGYQWGAATNSGANPSGIMGGLTGGYNTRLGQFVLGVETDLQASDAADMFAAWTFKNPWFGTVRGRAGYAMNNVLLYGTFGFAYGGGTVTTGGASEANTHVGWAGGVGMEIGLTPEWSAKAEYLFVDLVDQRYSVFGNTGFTSSIVRFGANRRF